MVRDYVYRENFSRKRVGILLRIPIFLDFVLIHLKVGSCYDSFMKKFSSLVEDDIYKIEKKLKNLFLTNNDIFKDLEIFILSKSKRIRSLVTLLYIKINNTEINEAVITLLSAGELIHNASLLHDDVIDDADLRRGVTTLAKKYNSKISILSGDYILSYAVKFITELGNRNIFDILTETTQKMSEAEIKQYLLRFKDVNLEEYLEIIYGKTASLFEAILKSSAILTNLNSDKAGEFGKQFGLLFQINNDLLEDSVNSDKKNGTKTIADILGIEKSNIFKDNYRKKMRAILEEFPDSKYKQVLEELIHSL